MCNRVPWGERSSHDDAVTAVCSDTETTSGLWHSVRGPKCSCSVCWGCEDGVRLAHSQVIHLTSQTAGTFCDRRTTPYKGVACTNNTPYNISTRPPTPMCCAAVYDPDAQVGRRYSRTAVYTNIFRAYHGNALLTSYGDILVAGEAAAATTAAAAIWGGRCRGSIATRGSIAISFRQASMSIALSAVDLPHSLHSPPHQVPPSGVGSGSTPAALTASPPGRCPSTASSCSRPTTSSTSPARLGSSLPRLSFMARSFMCTWNQTPPLPESNQWFWWTQVSGRMGGWGGGWMLMVRCCRLNLVPPTACGRNDSRAVA